MAREEFVSRERKRPGFPRRLATFLLVFLPFIALIGSFLLVQLLVPRSLRIFQRRLYISPPIVDGIHLSGLGFIVPLILAVLSLWFFRKELTIQHPENSKRVGKASMIFIILASVSAASSLILPQRLLFRPFGGTDYPLALIIVGYVSYLVFARESRLAVRIAYAIGFLLGFVSDLESLRFITNGSIFGGLGVFDGDFLEPLAMVCATFVASYVAKRSKQMSMRLNLHPT